MHNMVWKGEEGGDSDDEYSRSNASRSMAEGDSDDDEDSGSDDSDGDSEVNALLVVKREGLVHGRAVVCR
jgi:hypothetical protein